MVIAESVFFAGLGVIERLGATERFLVFFRDMREDFLSLGPTFGSSGLELLVGRLRDLVAEACSAGERFRFRRRRHCLVVGGEKRCVERVLDPCVGNNLKTKNASLKSCDPDMNDHPGG